MTAQKKKGQSSTCCRDSGTMEWKVENTEGEGSCKVCCSNCKWKTSYFTAVTPGLPYRKGLGTQLVSCSISDEHRYMEAPNNKFPPLPGGGDINTACQPFTKFITTSCCHALSSHPDLQPLWESKTSLIPSKSGCEFWFPDPALYLQGTGPYLVIGIGKSLHVDWHLLPVLVFVSWLICFSTLHFLSSI